MRTRERILAAAVDVLVEHGYAGLTMQRVQASAGVTRGALTHHFSSMREVAVAAVDYVADEQGTEIRSAVCQKSGGDVIEVIHEVTRRPTYLAGLELWMAARTDPELSAALRPGARRSGRDLRQVLVSLVGDLDEERFALFVNGLLALLRGLAIGGVLRTRPEHDLAVLETWVAGFVGPGSAAGAAAAGEDRDGD